MQAKTLASATSLTPASPPGLEIGQDFLFRQTPLLDLARHIRAEHGKQLALQLEGKGGFGARKEHTRQAAPAGHQDRILGPQQARRVVPEFPDRADSHVATSVVMIPYAAPGCITPRSSAMMSFHASE